MRKVMTGFAAVVVSLLVVAGCGSDSSTLSQEEYERQTELVCNEGLREREEVLNELSQEAQELGPGGQSEQAGIENLLRVLAIYERTTEGIDDVGLPEGNEEKAEALVREREEVAAKIKASPEGTRDSFGTIFDEASKLAASVGADACEA